MNFHSGEAKLKVRRRTGHALRGYIYGSVLWKLISSDHIDLALLAPLDQRLRKLCDAHIVPRAYGFNRLERRTRESEEVKPRDEQLSVPMR